MEDYTDRADQAPSEKKVWRHIQITPCPFRQDYIYSIQELVGAHTWDNNLKKTVFLPAKQPAATRVGLFEVANDGFVQNVYGSGYSGNKIYKD